MITLPEQFGSSGSGALLTEQLTPTGETILALFLYDENGDAVGDGHTVEAFKDIPFLAAVDSFFPLDNGQPIQIEFNGDAFAVPALSSKSEGPVVVILD